VLARLGGDEFALIVINANEEDSLAIAQNVYTLFQNSAFYHENKVFPVRASIGYVFVDDRFNNLSEVLLAADMACYSAKKDGGNTLSVFSDNNAQIVQQQEEINWHTRLKTAIDQNQFTLLFQGVMCSRTRKINHYEVLLRLIGEDGELVPPCKFLLAAERYDLMRSIDSWVIKNATQLIAEHHEALGGRCSFSINLSGSSISDVNLPSYIEQCIEASDVPASKIWFEVAETAVITHFQRAIQLFEQLGELGIKVALDNFGKGQSSFGYLNELPLDIIKLDEQFTRNIESNVINEAMVRAILQVSIKMNIELVANFVDTDAALQRLNDIGVHRMQGNLIATPLTIKEAVAAHQKKSNEDESGFSSAA